MSKEGTLDLLNEIEESLDNLKKSPTIKPVKVKSLLENLRSTLEYVANDAYDFFQPDTIVRPKIYFPYDKKTHVDEFFLKKLKITPSTDNPLYQLFSSIQDYNTGENWLTMMCNLTNQVKHRGPIPLKEESVLKAISVKSMGVNLITFPANSQVIFKGNIVNGVKTSDFEYNNGNLKDEENGAPLNFTFTEENKIRFHGADYEVIPFLNHCLNNIKKFVGEFYKIIEK